MTYWAYGDYYQVQVPHGMYDDYQTMGYPQALVPYQIYDHYWASVYPQNPVPPGAPWTAPVPSCVPHPTPVPAQHVLPPSPKRSTGLPFLRSTSPRDARRLKAMLELLAEQCRASAALDAEGATEPEVVLQFLPDTDAHEKKRMAKFLDSVALACHKAAEGKTGQE